MPRKKSDRTSVKTDKTIIKGYERDIEKLKKEKENNTTAISDYEQKVGEKKRLDAELLQLREKHGSKSKETISLKNKISETNDKLKAETDLLDTSRKKIDEMNEKILSSTTTKEERTDLKRKRNSSSIECKSLEENIESLSNSLKKLEGEMNVAKKAIDKLDNDIQERVRDLKKLSPYVTNEKEKKIGELRKKNENISIEISELEIHLKEYKLDTPPTSPIVSDDPTLKPDTGVSIPQFHFDSDDEEESKKEKSPDPSLQAPISDSLINIQLRQASIEEDKKKKSSTTIPITAISDDISRLRSNAQHDNEDKENKSSFVSTTTAESTASASTPIANKTPENNADTAGKESKISPTITCVAVINSPIPDPKTRRRSSAASLYDGLIGQTALMDNFKSKGYKIDDTQDNQVKFTSPKDDYIITVNEKGASSNVPPAQDSKVKLTYDIVDIFFQSLNDTKPIGCNISCSDPIMTGLVTKEIAIRFNTMEGVENAQINGKPFKEFLDPAQNIDEVIIPKIKIELAGKEEVNKDKAEEPSDEDTVTPGFKSK